MLLTAEEYRGMVDRWREEVQAALLAPPPEDPGPPQRSVKRSPRRVITHEDIPKEPEPVRVPLGPITDAAYWHPYYAYGTMVGEFETDSYDLSDLPLSIQDAIAEALGA